MARASKRTATGILAFTLLMGGTNAAAGTIWADAAPAVLAPAGALDLTSIIAQTTPSVVAIIGKPTDSRNPWSSSRFDLAHGTGVVVREDGLIVTNAHVVKDMKNIVVVTSDGKQYPGRTTHLDEESDLALVKIEAKGLRPAAFAAKSDVKVGESVIAIGTPISFALRNSVTYGVVSGIDRSVNSTYRLIQTDAAINPGNSGGALVNMKGEVIGINSLKYADSDIDNLGFAIPSDTVQYVIKQFLDNGHVRRPSLGFELEESWEAVVGLPTEEALRVSFVDPDSPAADSGVKAGDVLVKFDGVAVNAVVDLNELLKNYAPGQKVKLTVKTGAVTAERELTLGEEKVYGKQTWLDTKDDANIDEDQGKTRIGDSRLGWSMKYPNGLVKSYQSEKGDSVHFYDAKGEFGLGIAVSELQTKGISKLGLLRLIAPTGGSLVLDKQYMDKEPVPYARVIMKDPESDTYMETRGYANDSRVYVVSLYVNGEEAFKSSSKSKSHKDLLDSFQMAFDAKDKSLKDISTSFEGYREFINDYGVTISVPNDWTDDNYGSGGNEYSSARGDESVSIEVTSLSEGDTLEAWAKREQEMFEAHFTAAYSKIEGVSDVTAGALKGKSNTFSSTMGDGEWSVDRRLYFVKDGYKYAITMHYDKDDTFDEQAAIINQLKMIDTIRIERGDVDSSLGFIQDEDELTDQTKTVVYRNKKYGYTIEVPEVWSNLRSMLGTIGIDEDKYAELASGLATYSFPGGSFTVKAEKTAFDDAVKKIDDSHAKNEGIDANYKVERADITVDGASGKSFSWKYKTKDVPFRSQQLVFSKAGITYTITTLIDEAVDTELNAAQLDKATHSFTFTN
ncbi:S1C family serine protease [Paenibacillus cymbidii]|uniref:S1C family serine protease n=1 Tax=Paenibacillus cymbidii TaxID=1639034 RepID=UPI00107FDF41|nr:trypsin-like peptidase domain-containing protein [Paenibacillus cymbidii]